MPNTRGALAMTEKPSEAPAAKLAPAFPKVIRKDDTTPDPSLQEVHEHLKRADAGRTLYDIQVACATKARLLVKEGHLNVSVECLLGGCPMAYVARGELQENRISLGQYRQITAGACECIKLECPCNPDHDRTHKPETHERLITDAKFQVGD